MKILGAKLSTYRATMSVKYGKVCHLHFVIKVNQLLDVLVGIFHSFSLPDVAHDSSVESLDQKLKRANPKRISRLEVMMFGGEKHFISAAREIGVEF